MNQHTQTVPDKHSSLVGGSTAARRIACPRSYALEQKIPDDKSSAYAHEGTALHEMMTLILRDDKLPEELLPFAFTHTDGWSYTITEDIWYDLGQPALDAFDDFAASIEGEEGEDMALLIEKQVEYPGIAGAFGTADIIWRCGTQAGVWDWKFGRTPVSVEGNKQLMFYLDGALNTHTKFFDGTKMLWASIMQPQVSDKDDTIEVLQEDLVRMYQDLTKAVEVIQKQGEEAPMEIGPHCQFARCKAICPIHQRATLDLGEKLARIADVGVAAEAHGESGPEEEAGEWRELDWSAMMELAEMAKDWARETAATIQRLAEEDETIRGQLREDGWILKDKRSSGRDWVVSEATVVRGVRKLAGLGKKDIYKATIMSPKQVEDLLKRKKVELPEKWAEAKPSSGATLSRAHEGAQEYQTAGEKVRALAERLGHKG